MAVYDIPETEELPDIGSGYELGKVINMNEHYKSKGSDYVRKQIEGVSEREQAVAVFTWANTLCEEFLSRPEIPKGTEKMHVNGIAARAALYKVLKEQYPDKAWEWIDELTRIDSQKMRSFINRITSSKLLRRIFMPMMRTMTKKMFGPPSGFAQNIVESKKDSFSFDITGCPYQKWCAAFGEPELTKVFCDTDHYTYDDLPHFAFSRSQTLGYGGEKCDFKYWLK